MSATKALKSILKENEHLSLVETEYGPKVHCSLTNTDIKNDLESVKTFLDSKKYKQASEKWYDDSWATKYLPHIVPHFRNKKKLYCKLTKRELNKIENQVEKHVQGRKYKLRLRDYDATVSRKEEADALRKEKNDARKSRMANAEEFNAPLEEKFAMLEALAESESDEDDAENEELEVESHVESKKQSTDENESHRIIAQHQSKDETKPQGKKQSKKRSANTHEKMDAAPKGTKAPRTQKKRRKS